MALPRSVTWQPTTWLALSLKFAMALRDLASTGFWPAMRPRSRCTSAIWFLSASESMPLLRLILTSFGTWCLFL